MNAANEPWVEGAQVTIEVDGVTVSATLITLTGATLRVRIDSPVTGPVTETHAPYLAAMPDGLFARNGVITDVGVREAKRLLVSAHRDEA